MRVFDSLILGLQVLTIGGMCYFHVVDTQRCQIIQSTTAVSSLAQLKAELLHIYKPKWSISRLWPFGQMRQWERAKSQFLKNNDLRLLIKFRDQLAEPELYYILDHWIERAKQRLWVDKYGS